MTANITPKIAQGHQIDYHHTYTENKRFNRYYHEILNSKGEAVGRVSFNTTGGPWGKKSNKQIRYYGQE